MNFSGQLVSAIVSGRVVGVRDAGFEYLKGPVYFDDVNCTGNAWIPLNTASSSEFLNVRSGVVVGDNPSDPEDRRLYIPSPTTPSVVTIQSWMHDECLNGTAPLEGVPAVALDLDLHGTYPKPYSLLLN